MMSPSDLSATPRSEWPSERCSRYHHWETKQTKLLRSMSNKVPSSEVKMNSTIFSRFLRAILRSFCRQTTQSIWKMVWFSMSLYKFKSSRCSPCNQSSQRRRKVYRCWVSSSPIKRAKHETCKYDINHHGWSHHQGEEQIHFFQCRKDQWIHLTDVGNFHTPFWDELHSIPSI